MQGMFRRLWALGMRRAGTTWDSKWRRVLGGLLGVELRVLTVDRRTRSGFPLRPSDGCKDSGGRRHPRLSPGRDCRDWERDAPFSGTGIPYFKHSGFIRDRCQWA